MSEPDAEEARAQPEDDPDAMTRLHKTLQESQQRYATIFRMSPFAIALSKMPEVILVDVNDAFLALFEYTREEVLGKTSLDLRIADPSSRARLGVELAERGSVRDFECVRVTKSGARRDLSLQVDRVDIDGVPHVLTQAFDITERKASEARQLRLTEELAALNRDLERRVAERTEELRRAREIAEAANTAKTEFLSAMSHELRTPLNAILGFAQLLERDRKNPLDARQLERLQYVLRGGEHLLRLINDVLDLSKIEAGQLTISPEPVSVHAVLADVIATLEPMAARAEISIAPLEPTGPTEILRVTADRTRLVQILMNFGSNAIKYGKRGGHVTFTLAQRDPATVRVTVIDDGIGIPADKHVIVFEPFQRAGQEAGSIEGTGIGLTITKRLAVMMKGRVGFSSEVGCGSQFWIELPAVGPVVSPPSSPVPPVGASPLTAGAVRQTIIYIEDNPPNIALMAELLGELSSVELITAATAELGLDLIRAHRPDAVIMDVNLPGMSGLAALAQLRAWPETRDIPVIGLSAAALPSDIKRAVDAGFFRYLTKPVKVAELTLVLGEVLRRPPSERS